MRSPGLPPVWDPQLRLVQPEPPTLVRGAYSHRNLPPVSATTSAPAPSLGSTAPDAVDEAGWAKMGVSSHPHCMEVSTMALDKPLIDPIEGAPPVDLVIEDITVGTGDEAQPGQQVTVHYVGVAHSTGEEFDASWNRREPFGFPLGDGQVIAGWDKGVVGMKVGGRRKLVIPPHLGYGDNGAGGVIKPGETLIFVVDLLGVR